MIRNQILALLRRLQGEHGLTYLLITHDLVSVEDFAAEVAVMYRGRIVEQGPAAQVMRDPQDAYVRSLLSARLDYPRLMRNDP